MKSTFPCKLSPTDKTLFTMNYTGFHAGLVHLIEWQ